MRPSATARDRPTWATCTVWVRRVMTWSPGGSGIPGSCCAVAGRPSRTAGGPGRPGRGSTDRRPARERPSPERAPSGWRWGRATLRPPGGDGGSVSGRTVRRFDSSCCSPPSAVAYGNASGAVLGHVGPRPEYTIRSPWSIARCNRKYRPQVFGEVIGQEHRDPDAGARGPGATGGARLPVRRPAGHGEDLHGSHPGQSDQLRGSPPRRGAVRPVRHLPGHHSRQFSGRPGTGRGLAQFGGEHPGRYGSRSPWWRPDPPLTGSSYSTRRTCCPPRPATPC